MPVDYEVSVVPVDRPDGRKQRWSKVGAAFINRDGSISVKIDALPISGHLILQKPLPYAAGEGKPKSEPKEEEVAF